MPPIDETTPAIMISRYLRLLDVARDLASTLDLDELLNRIVLAAADVSNAAAATLLLYDEPAGDFYFQASTDRVAHLLRGTRVEIRDSIAGLLLEKRKPIILQAGDLDFSNYPDLERVVHLNPVSLLAVPLMLNERVLGVLETVNRRRGDFSLIDLQLLFALASQAAIGIENARLFQQSDLIAEFVHELRTPLASVGTAAHLLQRPETSAEQGAHLAGTIQAETERLSEMATSFLDLARLESGRVPFNLEEVDLLGLLRESAALMQNRIHAQGQTLEWALPARLPPLQADRAQLKQVILNLLSNALKYNCPKGLITIRAEALPDSLSFSISDTGPGIAPEHLPRLFERFYRVPNTERSTHGTGLGLSICKRIVNAHGGEICADSQLGAGATFTVTLPLSAHPHSEPTS